MADDGDSGWRVVFAGELRPGDRSIDHGGLTVVSARDSERRPEAVEVLFRSDDGLFDMFVMYERELVQICRTVDDHGESEPPGDDYDFDAERW